MSKKLKYFSNLRVIFLLFFIGVLLVITVDSSNTVKIYNENSKNISYLLRSEDSYVFGRACGILSEKTAQDLLGTKAVDLQSYRSGVGLGGISTSGGIGGKIEDNFSWEDSCAYESINNSLDYVGLSITTHQSIDNAKINLENSLPKVNNQEVLDASRYGDELIYDSGVYYLRRGKEVITISANKGSLPGTKEFVEQVFNELIQEF